MHDVAGLIVDPVDRLVGADAPSVLLEEPLTCIPISAGTCDGSVGGDAGDTLPPALPELAVRIPVGVLSDGNISPCKTDMGATIPSVYFSCSL